MKKRGGILLILVLLLTFSQTWSGKARSPERDDLIRLHVIANSDSPEDQALKLHVRDRLLLSFGETFQDAESMSQARSLIREDLDEMERIAEEEIRGRGYDYPVRAQLGVFPFPTKAYGDVVYPAGDYEALRVVIGEGVGANWWCVMFPPLCFVDVSGGVARRPEETEVASDDGEKKSGRDTKESDAKEAEPASREDGSSVREGDSPAEKDNKPEQKQVVYTFKLAEWWRDIQSWAARVFS